MNLTTMRYLSETASNSGKRIDSEQGNELEMNGSSSGSEYVTTVC